MQKWHFISYISIILLIFTNEQAMKRDDLVCGQAIGEQKTEEPATGFLGKWVSYFQKNDEHLPASLHGLERLSSRVSIFTGDDGQPCYTITDRQGKDLECMTPAIIETDDHQYRVAMITHRGGITRRDFTKNYCAQIYVELPDEGEKCYLAQDIWVSKAGFDALKFKKQ